MIVDVQPYLDEPESYSVTVGTVRLGLVLRMPVGGRWQTVPATGEYPDRNTAVDALVAAWQEGVLSDATYEAI